MSKYPKSELFEKLAAIEHERWGDWQDYCHETILKGLKGKMSPLVELELLSILYRWDRQINTDYKDLSEKEKDSDREQVMRYWNLLEQPEGKED